MTGARSMFTPSCGTHADLEQFGAFLGLERGESDRVSLTSVGPGGRMHVVASRALDVPFISRLPVDVDVTRRSC